MSVPDSDLLPQDIILTKSLRGWAHYFSYLPLLRTIKSTLDRPLTHLLPAYPRSLYLRFNHEGFCDGHKAHRKTPADHLLGFSGCLLYRRVACRPARETAFGPAGRSAAGFRRLGGRAQVRQKRRNGAVDPYRRQAAGVVAAFPR